LGESFDFPRLDFLPAKLAVYELKGIFCFKTTIIPMYDKTKFSTLIKA
jgi:hypothetical protein